MIPLGYPEQCNLGTVDLKKQLFRSKYSTEALRENAVTT